MDRAAAVELVRGLVAIPSLSRHEAAARAWLVEQMRAAGYDRAFVDEAGNAVGEIGAPDAAADDRAARPHRHRARQHPGPHRSYGRRRRALRPRQRRREGAARDVRRRRRARSAPAWARDGRPARRRRRRRRRGGRDQQGRALHRRALQRHRSRCRPPASSASRATGTASRSATRAGCCWTSTARQPMAHTAGPDASVATVVVDLWNWVSAHARHAFNDGRDKAFDQLSPSLRRFITSTTDADARPRRRADRLAPAARRSTPRRWSTT